MHEADSRVDPQSLTWDLFDDEYRKKLDKNKYVSLSRDRKAIDNNSVFPEEGPNSAENDEKAPEMNEESVEVSANGTNDSSTASNVNTTPDAQGNEDSDSESNWEDPGCSLFEMNMPGVLTKEEVEKQIDLDHWLLHDRDMFVEMEVRTFLYTILIHSSHPSIRLTVHRTLWAGKHRT
jgi:arginyl-tRNA---protein transferase